MHFNLRIRAKWTWRMATMLFRCFRSFLFSLNQSQHHFTWNDRHRTGDSRSTAIPVRQARARAIGQFRRRPPFDFVHVIQHLLDKFINPILRDQLFKHLVRSHDSTREPFAIRGMLR